MPAKMPEERIQKVAKTIADIEVGSEAIVEVFAVEVNLDRSCYLDPAGKIRETTEGRLAVKVRRDREGFHLYLNERTQKFRPHDIGPGRLTERNPSSHDLLIIGILTIRSKH